MLKQVDCPDKKSLLKETEVCPHTTPVSLYVTCRHPRLTNDIEHQKKNHLHTGDKEYLDRCGW